MNDKTKIHNLANINRSDIKIKIIESILSDDRECFKKCIDMYYNMSNDIKKIEEYMIKDMNENIDFNVIKNSIIGTYLKHDLIIREKIKLYDETDNLFLLSIKYESINCVEEFIKLKTRITNHVNNESNLEKPNSWGVLNHDKVYNENMFSKRNIIDINRRDKLGRTPLHFSCDMNLKEIVVLLYENGANFNIKDMYGKYPIHLILNKSSTYKSHLKKILAHIENNSNHSSNKTNKMDNGERKVKSLRIKSKHIKYKPELIISDGVNGLRENNINNKSNQIKNDNQIIDESFMINCNENILAKRKKSISIDMDYKMEYYVKNIRYIKKCDVLNFNFEYSKYIESYLNSKDKKIVKQLSIKLGENKIKIKHKRKSNEDKIKSNEDKIKSNMHKINVSESKIVERIMLNDSSKNMFENNIDNTKYDMNMIELIRLCGIDINKKDDNGMTLMHYVSKNGNISDLKEIINPYASIKEKDMCMMYDNKREKENRLKFNIKNNYGETAFLTMIKYNNIEMINYVLENRLNIIKNSKDMDYEKIDKIWFNCFDSNDKNENMFHMSIKYGLNETNIKNDKNGINGSYENKFKMYDKLIKYYKRVKNEIYQMNLNRFNHDSSHIISSYALENKKNINKSNEMDKRNEMYKKSSEINSIDKNTSIEEYNINDETLERNRKYKIKSLRISSKSLKIRYKKSSSRRDNKTLKFRDNLKDKENSIIKSKKNKLELPISNRVFKISNWLKEIWNKLSTKNNKNRKFNIKRNKAYYDKEYMSDKIKYVYSDDSNKKKFNSVKDENLDKKNIILSSRNRIKNKLDEKKTFKMNRNSIYKKTENELNLTKSFVAYKKIYDNLRREIKRIETSIINKSNNKEGYMYMYVKNKCVNSMKDENSNLSQTLIEYFNKTSSRDNSIKGSEMYDIDSLEYETCEFKVMKEMIDILMKQMKLKEIKNKVNSEYGYDMKEMDIINIKNETCKEINEYIKNMEYILKESINNNKCMIMIYMKQILKNDKINDKSINNIKYDSGEKRIYKLLNDIEKSINKSIERYKSLIKESIFKKISSYEKSLEKIIESIKNIEANETNGINDSIENKSNRNSNSSNEEIDLNEFLNGNITLNLNEFLEMDNNKEYKSKEDIKAIKVKEELNKALETKLIIENEMKRVKEKYLNGKILMRIKNKYEDKNDKKLGFNKKEYDKFKKQIIDELCKLAKCKNIKKRELNSEIMDKVDIIKLKGEKYENDEREYNCLEIKIGEIIKLIIKA